MSAVNQPGMPDLPRLYLWMRNLFGFQRRRMKAFEARFGGLGESVRVVDLGGHPRYWRFVTTPPSLTLLNIRRYVGSDDVPHQMVIGDARQTGFESGQFDIAFSNSLIEHLSGRADQQAFAAEVRRIAAGYYVQTPYKYAVFEPHLLVFLIHLLPRPVYKWLAFWLSPRKWLTGAGRDMVDREIDSISPLSVRDMRELFPDAVIERERVFGLTKSLIAIKVPGPS
ncbi:class I SAM-dependent methyltransferase [Paramagnetospirillum magneticum]|uniref:Methyltransferase type 11 domain-containing protein n=1 Tax=Paramagnetospirillum magneticum (strain ATCC 700264 / AMB-1) TaxID=342108 RepID=Q2W697_PARM1|nr:class I SAM-dependent methyltransferase [Paramagnetospirillum magneticum]BAE50628.1 hypothetical protein amb1824 [Paramagnetospirillum magneticum AMB-1]